MKVKQSNQFQKVSHLPQDQFCSSSNNIVPLTATNLLEIYKRIQIQMSRHQIRNLLFGDSEYSDAEIHQIHHESRVQYLLEQQTEHLYENLKEANLSGHQGAGSDSFLPAAGDKTQRQFHAQQQCKIVFPQVTAPSVQFSHSQFNLSKHNLKNPSEIRKTDEMRRRDLDIDRLGRLLIAKKQEQRQVNEVLDNELSSMAKEMSAMAKDIALKEALNNGLIKKVEALESELDRRKEELAAGKARELGWEKEFKKAAEEKEELFDVIDKKDKYFEEMRAELNESLNHIKQQQATIKSLRHDNNMLRDQLDLLGLAQKHTADLNIDRMPATKRSMTIYEQQLRKQSSVRTLGQGDLLKQQTKLLERLQGQKQSLEGEMQRLREKLASCEQGFLTVKQGKEDAEAKNEGLEKMLRQLQGELGKKEVELARERQGRENRDREAVQDKVAEYEKRFKTQNQELRRKEDKVKELLIEITEKNKYLQEANRSVSDLRGRIEVQAQKAQQATKENRILTTQLKEHRQRIKSMERVNEDKTKTRKQQDRIEQLKRDVVRLQKQLQQRQTTTKDLRKKMQQATKKAVLSRSRINQLQQQLGQVKSELAAQRENNKKQNQQFSQLKKRANQAEIFANKIKILETRLTSEKEKNQEMACKETYDLNDRVEALEEILRHKEEQLEELRDQLENSDNVQELRIQLQEKEAQLENYRREVEFREKSLEFLHNKLLKVERQKLQMQAQAKIFQSNFCEADSQLLTQGDIDAYSTKLTMRRDRNDFIQLKLKALQQRNRVLQDKLRDQTRKSKTGQLKDSSSRVEVLVLKNRVKQLTDMLNKGYSEDNAKKLPPESLSPNETLQFLLDTMRRVNKSSEMIKLLNRSAEFVELLRNIEKKKEETVYTKRLYL